MREIVAANAPFERQVWDRADAIAFFEARGERYKAELIGDLPATEVITLYKQGDWIDLCRGPHMRGTGDVGPAFKLMKVAGAYWRGDHRNAMLSRIYGTAWRDTKELDAHLRQLEEAERRDHRKIGRDMDLFHIQEEAVGSIFWHPKGWKLYRTVEDYMRRRLDAGGYQEVRTPQLVDRVLWEKSGHWEKFRDKHVRGPGRARSRQGAGAEADELPLPRANLQPRPAQLPRTCRCAWREFGACHRYEPSGALHGIMRVRASSPRDDAHIFCTEAQIAGETVRFVELLSSVYRDFGFDSFRVKFSDRPATRAGDDSTWDRAEAALRQACAIAGVDYELNPGEGAFYGPKLEFVLRDAIGRDWQCGTLQVDFVLPDRLDAHYIADDSSRQRPVMLHPRHSGQFRAFPRHPDRAIRRALPAVAGAGAGGGGDHRERCRGVCVRRRGEAAGCWAFRGNRRPQREDQRQNPRAQPGARPGDRRGRPQGGGDRHGGAAVAGRGQSGDDVVARCGCGPCAGSHTPRHSHQRQRCLGVCLNPRLECCKAVRPLSPSIVLQRL